MDSNIKVIVEHTNTDQIKWEVVESVYTGEQLEKFIDDNKEQIKLKDIVVINIGLKDVRKNTEGIETSETMRRVTKVAYQTILAVASDSVLINLEMETLWKNIESCIIPIITYSGDKNRNQRNQQNTRGHNI